MDRNTVEAVAYICITVYYLAVIAGWIVVVFVLDHSAWWTVLFITLLSVNLKYKHDQSTGTSTIE